ncbi:hypothetical protein M569_13993, partial [Genlisea aurea]
SSIPASSPAVIRIKPIEATPESFLEFGQVIEPTRDDVKFGPQDAQLDLSLGIPRLYVMHLEDKPLKFSDITHHAKVTQCLGSVGAQVWYLGIAKPSIVEKDDYEEEEPGVVVVHQSAAGGHFYAPPSVDEVRVFRISGPKFLMLKRGTWHAGPLFTHAAMDFYNLELSDTDMDFTTHDFEKENGVVFSVE